MLKQKVNTAATAEIAPKAIPTVWPTLDPPPSSLEPLGIGLLLVEDGWPGEVDEMIRVVVLAGRVLVDI